MLKPVGAKTFQDYAMLEFLPYIKAQLARVTRVDIIWDVYIPYSLKSTARENRGKGVRRRVAAANSIPGNWQEFQRVDENKRELFSFLAHEIVENLSTEKEVFSTCGKHVVCSRVHQDVSALAPCSHEEADTRMFLHAKDAAEKGHRRIKLRTKKIHLLHPNFLVVLHFYDHVLHIFLVNVNLFTFYHSNDGSVGIPIPKNIEIDTSFICLFQLLMKIKPFSKCSHFDWWPSWIWSFYGHQGEN